METEPAWLDRLRAHLRGRDVPDFRPADRRRPVGGEDTDTFRDEDEDGEDLFETMDVLDELLFGRTIAIDYCSARGEVSTRRITIRKVKAAGGHCQLCAVCHEAGAYRQFRLDRIEAIIDRHGEVFEPADYFREEFALEIGPLLDGEIPAPQKTSRRPPGVLPGVAILGAVAHADGFLHPEEVQVILQFADACAQVSGQTLADADIRQLEDSLAHFMTPDADVLKAAQGWLAKSGQGPLLARYARAVAEADNVLRPEEATLLMLIADELSIH